MSTNRVYRVQGSLLNDTINQKLLSEIINTEQTRYLEDEEKYLKNEIL